MEDNGGTQTRCSKHICDVSCCEIRCYCWIWKHMIRQNGQETRQFYQKSHWYLYNNLRISSSKQRQRRRFWDQFQGHSEKSRPSRRRTCWKRKKKHHWLVQSHKSTSQRVAQVHITPIMTLTQQQLQHFSFD